MIEINGEEVLLDKNQGPYGAYIYNKTFNRSVTQDVWEMVGKGEALLDSIALFRLVYILAGFNTKTTFVEFLKTVPLTYNILNDFETIIEKAQIAYFPIESPKKEKSKSKKETKDN